MAKGLAERNRRFERIAADTPLLEAELLLCILRQAKSPDENAIQQLCDFIAATPAVTRVGTMTKLRVLSDPPRRPPAIISD